MFPFLKVTFVLLHKPLAHEICKINGRRKESGIYGLVNVTFPVGANKALLRRQITPEEWNGTYYLTSNVSTAHVG